MTEAGPVEAEIRVWLDRVYEALAFLEESAKSLARDEAWHTRLREFNTVFRTAVERPSSGEPPDLALFVAFLMAPEEEGGLGVPVDIVREFIQTMIPRQEAALEGDVVSGVLKKARQYIVEGRATEALEAY